MGHFVHGSSRAFPSHVLRYGFLTINGRTGGVRVDAEAMLASSAADTVLKCMATMCEQNNGSQDEQTDLL